ncbi:MAG: hypothetical protein DRH93_18025 [Deltaproteobacteria bacterium]|nr:MAG: hypothetical protein DRH93_18025 [Deltaproteobacteria bacterium]
MKHSIAEDKQLLTRLLSGNKKASEELVRQFSDPVYKTIQYTLMARNVSFSTADLEDLHNTVFLLLFDNQCKKLKQYEGRNGCSLFSWIRMITVRTVLDHLRKKGLDTITSHKNLIPTDNLSELKDGGSNVLDKIEKQEQIALLNKAVQTLSARDQLFIKLHIKKGLGVNEAAGIMQLSSSSAYTLKHRAIKKLKQTMEAAMKNR